MTVEELLEEGGEHSVKTRIKQHRAKLIDNYVSNITLHGYVRFHEASGIRKAMWGIILILMIY